MNALNEALAFVGLQLNEKGQLVITQERVTLASPERTTEKAKPANSMTVYPLFKARDMKQEERLCFVVMPFRPSFDRLYKDKIKHSVEALGFQCLRADDFFTPTAILEDIWVHICKSKVLIADVTGKNPNVFYEIGIAHTIGKPVIIITQDRADIPFDIAQYRHFVYADDADGWNALCASITAAIKSLP